VPIIFQREKVEEEVEEKKRKEKDYKKNAERIITSQSSLLRDLRFYKNEHISPVTTMQ